MKTKTLNYFALLIIFAGCSSSINEDQLQVRGEVAYEVNSSVPYTGKVTSSYANGQKKSDLNYVEGRLQGDWFRWHRNGALYEKGSLSKGNGRIIFFNPSETMSSEEVYEDYELTYKTSFNKWGQLESGGPIEDLPEYNKLFDGPLEMYEDNDFSSIPKPFQIYFHFCYNEAANKAVYVDPEKYSGGNKEGFTIIRFEDGKICSRDVWSKEAIARSTTYYPSGQKVSEATYDGTDSYKILKREVYGEDGTLCSNSTEEQLGFYSDCSIAEELIERDGKTMQVFYHQTSTGWPPDFKLDTHACFLQQDGYTYKKYIGPNRNCPEEEFELTFTQYRNSPYDFKEKNALLILWHEESCESTSSPCYALLSHIQKNRFEEPYYYYGKNILTIALGVKQSEFSDLRSSHKILESNYEFFPEIALSYFNLTSPESFSAYIVKPDGSIVEKLDSTNIYSLKEAAHDLPRR